MNKKLLYLLLFLCSYSYAQSISTNYIRAKYTFDNGSVLEDSSVTGNDFTQTGTALTEINDRFDIAPTSAVSLNGDYLTRATIPVTGTSTFNVSYSFWLKTSTNTTDVKTVIDHSTRNTAIGFDSDDRGYYIFYRDGKISLSSRFIVTNPGYNPSVIGYGHEHPIVIADGKWHHIVVEFSALHNYQGQTVNSKIYIDKTVNSHSLTTSPITTTPITTGNVTIANSRYNHLALANRYTDVIDDLIIYDRKFTTAEVAVLANHNNYCFTPSASIITIPTTSNTAATVSIANSGTYDIAYHKASESFTNATIVTGITTGTANLSGLDIASDYLIYIREQCTNVTDWSSSVAFATTRPSTTLYVNKNATGDNDGTSWANAYVNLQDALTNVVSDDEIWIAGGTYTPHASDRNTYFVIDKENLKIYGGFAGTETQISDRIIGANETILSGDLQDNDVNLTSFIDNYGNTTRNSDNSYHIVDIKASGKNLELNSLTISDAHTNVDATEAGGAILKERTIAKLTIKNCIIKDNVSRNDNAGLLAVFDLNNVSGIRGTLIVENSQFINNMSRWATGIYSYPMTNTNVDITIVNSLFDGNITGNLNYTTAKGISGSAAWFRVLSNTSDLTLNFTNNTLVNNIDDGTLNVSASTHAVLALSKSSGFNGTFNAEVSNNIFWNNRTSGNAVTRSITDLYKLPITSLNVYNSIDESNFIDNSITSTVNISNADPLFTSATDFTLQSNSPAINTGDNTKVPSGVTTDLLGNQRVFNTTVDMGAYEVTSLVQRTLTLTNLNGNIIANPAPVNGTYDNGTVVTLTPNPDANYKFLNWSGDIGSNSNTGSTVVITMDADKDITAYFNNIFYQLTVTATTHGTVAARTPDQGSFGYISGSSVTLTATPSIGYEFDHWSGDVSGTNNPITFIMDAAKTVTPVFKPLIYTVTMHPSTDGSYTISPITSNNEYAYGTVVTLTATPNAGSQFSYFNYIGGAETVNPFSFTVEHDIAVGAVFTKIQRALTITAVNGAVTTNPNPTNGTYDDGTVVGLTATPATGYQFDGWSGDATGTANPLNITMDADKTVVANFSLIQRTLTINVIGTGTIDVTSGTIYNHGDVVTLIATPSTNFAVKEWTGDVTAGAINSIQITMDADKAITVEFESTLGIDNVDKIEGLNMYPNPTKGNLTVDLQEQIKTIELYNLQGQVVKRFTSKKVDISAISKGIYMVKITTESGKIAIKKIIKN